MGLAAIGFFIAGLITGAYGHRRAMMCCFVLTIVCSILELM